MAKNEKNFDEIIDAVNLENDDNVTALTHIFNSQEVLENKFRELYIAGYWTNVNYKMMDINMK